MEIDSLTSKNKDVLIIGATHHPDQIDSVIFNPGRLDQLVYVPLPDKLSRLSIFKAALKKYRITTNVDLSVLAEGTQRFSGASLMDMCWQAARFARQGKDVVTTIMR